jgi:hypothetical protein
MILIILHVVTLQLSADDEHADSVFVDYSSSLFDIMQRLCSCVAATAAAACWLPRRRPPTVPGWRRLAAS